MHHPETSLETLCHVNRRALGIAVDVRVHTIPPPEIVPFLYSVVVEAYVLQLSLVNLVLLKGMTRHISARDSCQRPAEVADREGDSLLLLVKAYIVRPQRFLSETCLD